MIKLEINYEFKKTLDGRICASVLVNGIRSAYVTYDWNGIATCDFAVLVDALNYNRVFESPDFKKELREFIDDCNNPDIFKFINQSDFVYSITQNGNIEEIRLNTAGTRRIDALKKFYNVFPTKELAREAIHMSTFYRCALLFAWNYNDSVDKFGYFDRTETNTLFQKYKEQNKLQF